MRGDLYALAGHFALGIILIFFFETVVYQSCWLRMCYICCKCCFRTATKGRGKKIFEELKQIDDDVLKEEERVVAASPSSMQVRVA